MAIPMKAADFRKALEGPALDELGRAMAKVLMSVPPDKLEEALRAMCTDLHNAASRVFHGDAAMILKDEDQ